MNDSPRTKTPLGRTRLLESLFLGGLAAFAMPVPLLMASVAGYLVWSSFGRGESWADLLHLTWGSVSMAGCALLLASPLALLCAAASRSLLSPHRRRQLGALLSVASAFPMIALGFLFAQMVAPTLHRVFGTPLFNPFLSATAMSAGVLPILWGRFLSAFDQVPAPLVEGAIALGADRSQVMWTMEAFAALPALLRALAESASRVLGESVVILMVSGSFASGWGGIDGAASLGGALLVFLPDAHPDSPMWVQVHRSALLLLGLSVGVHLTGSLLSRARRSA